MTGPNRVKQLEVRRDLRNLLRKLGVRIDDSLLTRMEEIEIAVNSMMGNYGQPDQLYMSPEMHKRYLETLGKADE